MEIREANIKDLSQIHSLSQQLGYSYPIKKMNHKLQQVLLNQNHKIFIATIANKVVGYIHIEKYSLLYTDDLLNILGIVVDFSYRGKGIGSSLIQASESYAKENNCNGIRANSGITRQEAHIFYEQNGFEILNDQKRFIKRTDI